MNNVLSYSYFSLIWGNKEKRENWTKNRMDKGRSLQQGSPDLLVSFITSCSANIFYQYRIGEC